MGLRILLVTPMPPQAQAPGAIPLVLYAQLSGLREHHEVSLVTVAGQEPGERQAVQDLKRDGLDVHAVVREEPYGWRRWQRRWRMGHAWLTRRLPWRTVWFWEPEVQSILERLFETRAFDLAIVEDNAMGIYDYSTDTPLLFTEHEVRRPRSVDYRFWKQHSLPAWALGEVDWRRWPGYQRHTWQKFDHIQVFSHRDAQAVRQLAPDLGKPVSVNPFGIVLPAPARPENEQPHQVLFVGNFTHAPNVDAALWLGRAIMPRLTAFHPGVHLNLVGIYPPDEVRALESETVHVTGPVRDIRPYMEVAAVVLAPVRIGGGMRMKVLQALAMGKAVVTTTRGAEGLEAEAEPPLKVADDAEGFACAAAALLEDEQARRALGAQGRAFAARHFSPQAYTERIEATYAAMIAGEEGER